MGWVSVWIYWENSLYWSSKTMPCTIFKVSTFLAALFSFKFSSLSKKIFPAISSFLAPSELLMINYFVWFWVQPCAHK